VALLAYTSGTTSTPKGVMITHRGLVQTSRVTGRLWGVEPGDDQVALSVAPLYAAQGFLAVLIDLCNGLTMHWLSSFNPNEIIRAISKGRARLFHTQPTMWSLLLSSPLAKFASFKKLQKTVVSGSLCSRNLAERIEATTGSVLLNAYGLIEATGVVTATRPEDAREVRLSTVGRPIPGVEVRIVDKERHPVKPGETGEVAIRGYLMKGYYKNEARTREVIDEDGWLYSGDLGRVYEGTDNIQIVGRARELIIRGGFNVYPIDVEEQVLLLDGVQDVAVVGRGDDILGEAIVAFVVPKPGQRITRGDLLRRLRENLSSHKLPDEVHLLRQLPTILSGKVLKNVLCEWAATEVPREELEVA
jgi:fatty-acyl-CoA synthase